MLAPAGTWTSRRKPPKTDAAPRKWVTPVVYTTQWAYAPIGMEGARELFDLDADPYAENNIAPDHPDLVQELHQKLLDWLREIDAPPEAIAAMR